MRDLSTDELRSVYGAGSTGRRSSPQPPSCNRGKGSKSKGSRGKKSKKSKGKGSRRGW